MQIYPTLLSIHGYWRWVVLLAAVASIIVAIRGLSGGRPFAPGGRKAGVLYVAAIDMQFLIGIGLLFLSPVVRSAWMDVGAAMKVKELRFFLVEHTTAMFIAVALAHIGWVRCKKAASDALKYRRILLWNCLSLVAILIGIPWLLRPLFRSLS
jgi:hypothetical protein